MTFALLAAAPPPLGLGCHVIYVDTEGKFSPQRMAEITQTRWADAECTYAASALFVPCCEGCYLHPGL
jgi:hypothetical protein